MCRSVKFETIRLEPEIEPETGSSTITETVRGDVDRKLSDVFSDEQLSVNQRIRKTLHHSALIHTLVRYCACTLFGICMIVYINYIVTLFLQHAHIH